MGYMNICLYLLQHGSCPNTTTVRGETALHLAARANHTTTVRGETALHLAARANHTTTVRGETALHLAARANQTDIIRILLRNGATVDARARVSSDSVD